MENDQYFEGILQLRNPSKEAVLFIRKDIGAKAGVSIAKEKIVQNGIDFYISSQRYLRTLGNKLQQRFKGQLKFSKRLHTRNRQTSRDVYRVNVLFSMTDYNVGDIVKIGGKIIKITHLGKKIHGIETDTNRKVTLPYC